MRILLLSFFALCFVPVTLALLGVGFGVVGTLIGVAFSVVGSLIGGAFSVMHSALSLLFNPIVLLLIIALLLARHARYQI